MIENLDNVGKISILFLLLILQLFLVLINIKSISKKQLIYPLITTLVIIGVVYSILEQPLLRAQLNGFIDSYFGIIIGLIAVPMIIWPFVMIRLVLEPQTQVIKKNE